MYSHVYFHLSLSLVPYTVICSVRNFHYCLVFKITIEASIYVHENDGRIDISLVTDGTLKFIYKRRTLHFLSMTFVSRVIERLFSNHLRFISCLVFYTRGHLIKIVLAWLSHKCDRHFSVVPSGVAYFVLVYCVVHM